MNRRLQILALAALISGLCPPALRADELKLKDGTKISGTIIGFDDNSFKVKTNYGYAMVQKDQVVSIVIAEAAKKLEQEKKPEAEKKLEPEKKTEAEKKPDPVQDKTVAAARPAKSEPLSAAPHAKPSAPDDASKAADSSAIAAAVKRDAPEEKPAPKKDVAPAKTSAPSVAVPVVAEPPKPDVPEPVREEVSGNTYTNKTFGFQMYKPPAWQVIEGARSILPGAITAMGTSDQSTYLLIGQEPAGKSLAGDIADTEQRLHEILENYRPLGEKRVAVSGASVVERRFRGSIDHRDWSGVIVFVPRDTHLYTIFAMTVADNDLVQIQENVISRAISSFQFTKQ
jgi:hypothetical protein